MANSVDISGVLLALAVGLLPTLVWLFFWLWRDRVRPEPPVLLFLCFILGAASMVVSIPLEQLVMSQVETFKTKILWWALIEETLKFLPVYLIALQSKYNDEAIDPAMYMITAALGFAALENVAYALHPEYIHNITASLLSGSLRFFGATLLHVVASGFVGICIGLAAPRTKWLWGIVGLLVATFLHTTFNFFIMEHGTTNFLQIYGYLWVAAIISVLILEKLRRIPSRITVLQKTI